MLKAVAVASVLCLCAGAARGGITITSVDRAVSGQACVNAPPFTLNWCLGDSSSNTTAGDWFGTSSNGPSAAGEVGSATAIAQATQFGSITDENFQLAVGIYTFLETSGMCSGSTTATNRCEVTFSLASAATMHISTTATNTGTQFVLSVAPSGGAAIYTSSLSDIRDLALEPGNWEFSVRAHDDLACPFCFSSKSSNLNTNVTFEFGACVGDLNLDGMVEDSDFTIFVVGYNELLCPDAPAACPADFNADGYVDDADFIIFVVAYDQLLCP